MVKLDEVPLPRIDDTLDRLTESRHFSTLDLASGYWQVAGPLIQGEIRVNGLASYYRKCVPDFAKVAGPLHALTKKEVPFLRTPKCKSAFCELKRLLTRAPVLSFPDFTKLFILETYVPGAGLETRWYRTSNLLC